MHQQKYDIIRNRIFRRLHANATQLATHLARLLPSHASRLVNLARLLHMCTPEDHVEYKAGHGLVCLSSRRRSTSPLHVPANVTTMLATPARPRNMDQRGVPTLGDQVDPWSLVFTNPTKETMFLIHSHVQKIKVCTIKTAYLAGNYLFGTTGHGDTPQQMLRALDVLTCTLFWYRLALQAPFSLYHTHSAFMLFTAASMAVTTLANLLPLRWYDGMTPPVCKYEPHDNKASRYAPKREGVVAINFLITNIIIVPAAVSHVLSRPDASMSDVASALTFATWIVLLCPLYCGAREDAHAQDHLPNHRAPLHHQPASAATGVVCLAGAHALGSDRCAPVEGALWEAGLGCRRAVDRDARGSSVACVLHARGVHRAADAHPHQGAARAHAVLERRSPLRYLTVIENCCIAARTSRFHSPVMSRYHLRSGASKRGPSRTVDMAHPAPRAKRSKAARGNTDTEQQLPNLLLDLPDNALDNVLEALSAKELAVLQAACSPRQLTVRVVMPVSHGCAMLGCVEQCTSRFARVESPSRDAQIDDCLWETLAVTRWGSTQLMQRAAHIKGSFKALYAEKNCAERTHAPWQALCESERAAAIAQLCGESGGDNGILLLFLVDGSGSVTQGVYVVYKPVAYQSLQTTLRLP